MDSEEELPADWDPAPQEREWYRATGSGDLGWRVRRGGADKIKYDRPLQNLVVPFRPGEWTPENERRPLTIAQVAEIAFVADRRLITYTHNPGLKKQWVDLGDTEKIEWMKKGPQRDPLRAKLYRKILEAFEGEYR